MDEEFFEEDEPIEAIEAILRRPVEAVTTAPRDHTAWLPQPSR